jgi:tetratricopeptide (TPR) repeat protein
MMKPRFFVVMPFSKKEVQAATLNEKGNLIAPAQEANFDIIYQKLIRPALEKADCEPFRADEEVGAGDIRTDMYFELVTADFVLADISILNPNVFYELGIRHGVAPRGVLLIHGGWSKRPFDVAPDRTFNYDGALFAEPISPDSTWEAKVRQEAEELAERIRTAVAHDDRGIGSPVYKELAGLRPVDWTDVQAAKAKFFRGVLDDWKSRVRVAQNEGFPSDILTLAADAPSRYHYSTLLYQAAKALIALNRMEAARSVLEELLDEASDHFDARCQLGLVHARLGHLVEAEEELRKAAKLRPGSQEAQGILGRVYKDMWRARWQSSPGSLPSANNSPWIMPAWPPKPSLVTPPRFRCN